MKKTTRRFISLFMAATIFATSGMTVYASETNIVLEGAEKAGIQPEANAQAQTPAMEKAQTPAAGETQAPVEEKTQAPAAGETQPPATEETQPPAAGETQTPTTEKTQPPVEGEIVPEADAKPGAGTTVSPVEGEVIQDENNDEVEIKKNDRPYLALGADLTEEQRNTVLSLMGIDPANLSSYDVVYVTNDEEHRYLGSYIDASQIGSKSWSSVVIVKRKKGSGLNISTSNINYCTVGMYKNALTTAGITDADIIVAGPKPISGTAALVGIFKAYEEMTGEDVGDNVVDAALNELVITGQLAESIEGLSNEEVEEFIAYIKSVIAQNDLKDEDSIHEAIDNACEKYGVVLSDAERRQITDLLLKITSLGIDLNGLVDYASSLYDSFKNGGGGSGGMLSSIGEFFSNAFTAIADFFKGLFS